MMYIVIKSTVTEEVIEIKLSDFYAKRNKRTRKGFNALKYSGKLKDLFWDGLKY